MRDEFTTVSRSRALSALPFVSVIIPHLNNSRGLLRLLESLARQHYPRDSFEIIVVDNGSATGIDDVVMGFNVRLGYERELLGSYAARNKGIRLARGEILCFIDCDCTAHENWIAEGVKTLRERNAHLVGGNVIFTFSEKRQAAEYYDAITNMGIEAAVKERGVAKTANLFIKKEILARTGLFPGHLVSGGDIYFTAKAVQEGFRLAYSPGAYIYHPTRTFSSLIQKSLRVGAGKAAIHKLSKKQSLVLSPAVFQSRGYLTHLNPLDIKRRLNKAGYQVGFFKFLSILGTSYCYLIAMFTSRWYGLYLKRGKNRKEM
jgi:glycosyltransferase AglE